MVADLPSLPLNLCPALPRPALLQGPLLAALSQIQASFRTGLSTLGAARLQHLRTRHGGQSSGIADGMLPLPGVAPRDDEGGGGQPHGAMDALHGHGDSGGGGDGGSPPKHAASGGKPKPAASGSKKGGWKPVLEWQD